MASIIKIKRSSTQGSVPSGLQVGELAVNLFDRKLYVGNSTGVTAVGGEDFRLTTQDSDTGAYIKLLGESVLSTNNILLRSGTGIAVTREGNGSISIAATGESTATAADALSTPRRISLGGDVSGWADFDGSANVTITATVADDSHAHIIANVDGLQAALDAKATEADSLARLANTNSYIATKLNSSTAASTYQTIANERAALANTNAYIATVDAKVDSNLANTNSYIATKISTTDAQNAFVNVSGDTMTGALTLHDDPSQALHAATKRYVDELAQGISAKPAVVAATTADLSGTYDNGTAGVGATLDLGASATLTIDGISSWSQFDGVLVKNQTNPEENGRYYVSQVGDAGTAWILTRCGLCDEASEIPSGYVFVQEGTTYAGTGWVANVDNLGTFTVGTDDINWIQFSGAGTYLAGRDLEIDGTTFNLAQTITANTSGNAATATKLATARTITLGGDLSGSAGFDGSTNITITATVADDSHNHVISNVDGLQDALNAKTDEVDALARLANTNSYIATKLNTSTAASTYQTIANEQANLANTNAYIASVAATELSHLANTNARIAAAETNIGQKLGATATVTLTGDITGTASFSGNTVSIATTYNNDVVLGTDTSGNYVAAISGTANEIEVTGSGSETATVTIGLPNDVTIGNDLTVTNDLRVNGDTVIDGNLTVEGALTYISTSTVYADDGMFKLAANNSGDAVDTGIYAKYTDGGTAKYAGYFRDATDGVFKIYTGVEAEPTTTVDTTATGYTLGQLDAVIDGGTY
jgi:hypothetical protein